MKRQHLTSHISLKNKINSYVNRLSLVKKLHLDIVNFGGNWEPKIRVIPSTPKLATFYSIVYNYVMFFHNKDVHGIMVK